jgi:hypothetical protein
VMPALRQVLSELHRVLAPGAPLFASAITVPLGAVLPSGVCGWFPAILKSAKDFGDELRWAGFVPVETHHHRLAVLMEARKS